MPNSIKITVEFVNDGLVDFSIVSEPHGITVMGIPPSVNPELWLLSIILRAIQPAAPTINAQHRRSKRINGVAKPAYADGHAVERIRLNKNAKKGDL